MLWTHKALRAENKELRSKLIMVHRQLAIAADMTHDNLTYKRGWIDCLKFINSSLKKPPQATMPGSTARQGSVTHRAGGSVPSTSPES